MPKLMPGKKKKEAEVSKPKRTKSPDLPDLGKDDKKDATSASSAGGAASAPASAPKNHYARVVLKEGDMDMGRASEITADVAKNIVRCTHALSWTSTELMKNASFTDSEHSST